MSHSESHNIEDAILKSLLYYDVFNYPLTQNEIWKNLSIELLEESLLNEALEVLLKKQMLFKFGDFYTVQNRSELVARRLKGNLLAEKMLKKARLVSNIIGRFPFVRAVFISGSLSKNYADERSDADFFVITDYKRLWIVRSLFFLFKKIILFNNNKYFCFNYMIDTSCLKIEEQSQYTAVEIVTLMPMSGHQYCKKFLEENTWVSNFFPNHSTALEDNLKSFHKNLLTQFFEFFLNNKVGDNLNEYLMKMTNNWWDIKFKDRDVPKDNRFFLGGNSHYSKEHDKDHYPRIMESFKKRIMDYQMNFNNKVKQ